MTGAGSLVLTYCASSSAIAASVSAPFLSALPCQLSLPSKIEQPFPLRVRATIIVGLPVVFRASASAASTCFMSWPSMLTVCQPNARQRATMLFGVALPLRRAALAVAVDVDDAAEVVELVVLGHVRGFPHRAFRGFAVAHQHVRAIVGADPARVQRDADAGSEPLSERSGRDVHERQPRCRMPFEIGGQQPQLQHFAARKHAGRRPGRVQDRRRVAFRQHEPIRFRMLRVAGIESHLGKEQRRDDLRRRQARRRMSGAGFGRREHRIDSKLCGEILENGE